MKTDYDFPVETTTIKANGVLVPKRMAVVRSDTKQPMGIVSDKYGLVQHTDVIKGLKKALKDYKTEEKIEVLRDGARMVAQYRLPEVNVEVEKGDKLDLTIIAKNSYDGSKSFQLMMGAYRLICSNGMVIGRDFFTYTRKHLEKGVTVDSVLMGDRIQEMIDGFKKTIPAIQKMAKIDVSEENSERLFNPARLHMPKYLAEEARTSYEHEGVETLWGYYNSLTYAITHKMRKDNTDARIGYTQRVWGVVANMAR